MVDITTWVGEEPLEPRTWAQKRSVVRMGWAWRKAGTSSTDGEKRCTTQEGRELGGGGGLVEEECVGILLGSLDRPEGLGKSPVQRPSCVDMSGLVPSEALGLPEG